MAIQLTNDAEQVMVLSTPQKMLNGGETFRERNSQSKTQPQKSRKFMHLKSLALYSKL